MWDVFIRNKDKNKQETVSGEYIVAHSLSYLHLGGGRGGGGGGGGAESARTVFPLTIRVLMPQIGRAYQNGLPYQI